jgi:hypothetical protein
MPYQQWHKEVVGEEHQQWLKIKNPQSYKT